MNNMEEPVGTPASNSPENTSAQPGAEDEPKAPSPQPAKKADPVRDAEHSKQQKGFDILKGWKTKYGDDPTKRFEEQFGKSEQIKMPTGKSMKGLIVSKPNVAHFIKRNDDGTSFSDGEEAFAVQRENDSNVTYAVFQKHGAMNKLMRKKITKYFTSSLATYNSKGGMDAWFDSETYEQTVNTSDQRVSAQVSQINRKLGDTIRTMIFIKTENDRLRKGNSFLEKYLPNILLFLALIMLAIAIFQDASAIAGLKTTVSNVGSQISALQSIVNSVAPGGGIPSS